MTARIRKKIIRPLYPIALVVLGLCFAFHFGEIRGTVAISSDSETSKDNYFEAWSDEELTFPARAMTGESFEGDIAGGENLTGEDINQDNILSDDAGSLDNSEDANGAPVVAGEEITAPFAPLDEPSVDAPDSDTENLSPPAEPQNDDSTVEDNTGDE